MSERVLVRDALARDLLAMLAIHNDVIATTTAIYEETPATEAAFRNWHRRLVSSRMPVLVAEDGAAVVGYAALGPFRSRFGYRHTVEDTVHVRADARGRGVGGALLRALIERGGPLGIHCIIAMIDAGAAASIHLHRSLGFDEVGRFREISRLGDRWLDLVAMQKLMGQTGSG